MLGVARERFRDDAKAQVVKHDLVEPLPDLGRFDAVVSSLAIHHVSDKRKRALYSEIHAAPCPGGVFCDREHVTPASTALHRRFLEALGTTEAEEDPSHRLAKPEIQLDWLREIGFRDVDCQWKWLELTLRRRDAGGFHRLQGESAGLLCLPCLPSLEQGSLLAARHLIPSSASHRVPVVCRSGIHHIWHVV